jgi:hypothetical protein
MLQQILDPKRFASMGGSLSGALPSIVFPAEIITNPRKQRWMFI